MIRESEQSKKKDNLNLKGNMDDILKLAVNKDAKPKKVKKRKRVKKKI